MDAVLHFTVKEEIGRYMDKKMAAYANVYASYLKTRMGEAIGVDAVIFHSSSVLACSMTEYRNNNCGGSGDHSRLPLWSLHYVLPLPSKEPIECQEAHSDEGQ